MYSLFRVVAVLFLLALHFNPTSGVAADGLAADYVIIVKPGPIRTPDREEVSRTEVGECYRVLLMDHNQLLVGHSRLGWIDAGSAIDLAEALPEFHKRAQFDRSFQSMCDVASVLCHQGRFDPAIKICDAVLERKPLNKHAIFVRAMALSHEGEIEKSLVDANRLIDLAPRSAAGYLARGMARGADRDFDGSLSDYNRALDVDPDNYESRLRRADLLQRLDKRDDALEEVNYIITRNPFYGEAWAFRAGVLWNKQRFDEARQDIERLLESFPEMTIGLILQAHYLRLVGKPDDALHALGKAIEKGDSSAYSIRGMHHFEQRCYEEAIADLRKGLSNSYEKPEYAYFLGEAYRLSDDYEGAILNSVALLKRFPEYTPALGTRALAYAALGKLTEAQADAEQMVMIEPKKAWGYAVRSAIHTRSGNDDLGAADANRAREICPDIELPVQFQTPSR